MLEAKRVIPKNVADHFGTLAGCHVPIRLVKRDHAVHAADHRVVMRPQERTLLQHHCVAVFPEHVARSHHVGDLSTTFARRDCVRGVRLVKRQREIHEEISVDEHVRYIDV